MWFRPRVDIFWKTVATCLLGFYFWICLDDIDKGISSFQSGWYSFIAHFGKELLALVYVNLFFLWPATLIVIFFKRDSIGAERLLKFMCVLTLLLWIVFILYYFFSKGIDDFIFKKLKEMVPYGR
jgi:hypothetical protein